MINPHSRTSLLFLIQNLHVKEKELIPSCPKCAEKGRWKAILKKE